MGHPASFSSFSSAEGEWATGDPGDPRSSSHGVPTRRARGNVPRPVEAVVDATTEAEIVQGFCMCRSESAKTSALSMGFGARGLLKMVKEAMSNNARALAHLSFLDKERTEPILCATWTFRNPTCRMVCRPLAPLRLLSPGVQKKAPQRWYLPSFVQELPNQTLLVKS